MRSAFGGIVGNATLQVRQELQVIRVSQVLLVLQALQAHKAALVLLVPLALLHNRGAMRVTGVTVTVMAVNRKKGKVNG